MVIIITTGIQSIKQSQQTVGKRLALKSLRATLVSRVLAAEEVALHQLRLLVNACPHQNQNTVPFHKRTRRDRKIGRCQGDRTIRHRVMIRRVETPSESQRKSSDPRIETGVKREAAPPNVAPVESSPGVRDRVRLARTRNP